MANDITNELTFSKCTEERFQEILKAIQIDSVGIGSIDFDKIIPQPTGLYMEDLGPREMELYKDNNWYDWRHKHWGTKWNSYGYDREQGIDEDQNQIRFITANRSAFKIIEELSRQYPDVLFEMRYADEDFGYNTGAISFTAGEVIEANLPKDGTLEAQEFAADVMGIKLEFDIDSASGYVRMIDENLFEYCEGVHVSQSFQCDQSLGHPVVLCYDFDNEKVWLERYPLLDEDDDMFQPIVDSIKAWGIHPCSSWDEFNTYVQCLGEDAMEVAYHDEGGMTMC